MWEIPENPQTALADLERFHEIGLSILEIKESPLPIVWEQIHELGFSVYGNLSIEFPITQTFEEPDSLFIEQIEKRAANFLAQASVQGLGLFEFGSIHRDDFLNAAQPFINQLRNAGAKIYFVSGRTLPPALELADFIIYQKHLTPRNLNSFSLPTDPAIQGYRLSVSPDLKGLFIPFNRFLNETPSDRIIFLDSEWLFVMLDKYPHFKNTLLSLSREQNAVFPVPDETVPEQNRTTIPILVLLIAWGLTAILYSSNPLYRKSLFRYFSGHKFFIKDIFDRHIRSPWPAFIIIFQNGLLISTSVFCVFSIFFSPMGQNAFYHYFPALALLGRGPLSLFCWTFMIVLAFSAVSIIWLFSLHKRLNSITQIATIYAWPLQVNIVLVTAAIALFASGGNESILALLSLFALLIFLLSFIFTSFDAARFIYGKPKLYLIGTTGIYIILIGALIAWLLTQDDLRNVMDLALRLK